MRDLAPILAQWLKDERRFALATVVRASGSSPRAVGSAMLIREDGLIAGSVSGGCVEGAVTEAGLRSIVTGRGELLEYGPASEAAFFEVGLSCGGQIQVWVEPGIPRLQWLAVPDLLSQRVALERATLLDPDSPAWTISFPGGRIGEPPATGSDVFCSTIPVSPRLVVVGAVHIAVALVRLASTLGFETVVIDPRSAFSRADRFESSPTQILSHWPVEGFASLGLDADTFVAILSHDAKIDEPAIAAALSSKAAYVGALGSRHTQAKRQESLRKEGLTDDQINRLHGPIGLDIGADTPDEIALSILAEIVKARRRGLAD